MKLEAYIKKIITAIRFQKIDLKIDQIETYSERLEKYCLIYRVYVKKQVEKRTGEIEEKYVLQDTFVSKKKLLEYLVDEYKKIGSETGWKKI